MIYFIQVEDDGPIKIGYTQKHPRHRLKALQCGNPYQLHLLKVISGDWTREQNLHKDFNQFRMPRYREWFKADDTLLKFIASEPPYHKDKWAELQAKQSKIKKISSSTGLSYTQGHARSHKIIMEAGRELDALVAEKLTGWERIKKEPWPKPHWSWLRPDGSSTRSLPTYSTRLLDAWKIVRYILCLDESNTFALEYGFDDEPEWCASFGAWGRASIEAANTAPLAICLAALKVVGEEA